MAKPAEVLAWLRGLGQRTGAGRANVPLRIFADGAPCEPAATHHATADDASITAYIDRLEAELAAEAGLLVNDFQALAPELWLRILGFLHGFYSELGIPAGGALLDLFIGRYETGFFGLHKDDQDVFTFIIEGRKRFLVWPYHVFADRPEVPNAAHFKPVMLTHVDYSDVLDQAIVVEGGPGDLLYWPVDHWHVAVAADDVDVVSTLSLGLFREADPARFIGKTGQAMVDAGEPTPEVLPHALSSDGTGADVVPRLLEVIRQRIDDRDFQDRLEETVLAWTTAYGFRVTPEPAPLSPLPEESWQLGVTLARPIAWVVRDGERLVWSVTGAVHRYPHHPAMVGLFEIINAGETFECGAVVSSLLEQYADHDVAIEADSLRHILGVLLRHHVLERKGDAHER